MFPDGESSEEGKISECLFRELQIQGDSLSTVCVCTCMFGREYGKRGKTGIVGNEDEKADWGKIIKDVLIPC